MKKLNALIAKLNKIRAEKKEKGQKGFTLVELLVVIAILAILASVSVVGYLGFTTQARQSNARTELTQFRDMLIAEDINNDNFEIGSDSITFEEKTAAKPGSDVSTLFTVSGAKTSDEDLDDDTTYYTVDDGVYTAVASPAKADLDNYYELTATSVTGKAVKNTIYYSYNTTTKVYSKATVTYPEAAVDYTFDDILNEMNKDGDLNIYKNGDSWNLSYTDKTTEKAAYVTYTYDSANEVTATWTIGGEIEVA